MRLISRSAIGLFVFLIIGSAYSQPLPVMELGHERVLLIVPMVGAGTPGDPRRPMGIPAGGIASDTPVNFRYVCSDDGKTAIVLLSAQQRAHIDALLVRTGLVDAITPSQLLSAPGSAYLFDPKQHARATVEAVFKTLRKNGSLESFLSGMPLPGGKQ